MAKRSNPRGSQLVRGFLMGLAYGSGHKLTTARIRKLGASRATAKRDMAKIRKLVPVLPSKPLLGMVYHVAQQTKAGK
jgi:hypothetical protein